MRVPDTSAFILRHGVLTASFAALVTFITFTCHAEERAALRTGDHGRRVEMLQRTLNARLDSSTNISVDGDFGPETESAVRRFQREKKLSESGVVDAATWKALGELVTSDNPVPAPSVINSQKLQTLPADSLDGPPFVTCKSWIIADVKTGETLWSHAAKKRLDPASTTKIMTAYLVLRAAENEPKILDQVVTFSERADRTRGSSAVVYAGESLSVRELLFGLLLPSGNDASVALAEHFGLRFDRDAKLNDRDALAGFVYAMNAAARELALMNTAFKNPHGMSVEGHHSTAEDLAKLATVALKLPTFRKYVRTRQHGCTLVGQGGYRRNVVWKNTNRLLPTEGYFGVKTGTTSAAGACLVSAAQRGERELLVVVLGSTSSDARYVDTRNLLRWAWTQETSTP